jgi:translation initiation factor 4A
MFKKNKKNITVPLSTFQNNVQGSWNNKISIVPTREPTEESYAQSNHQQYHTRNPNSYEAPVVGATASVPAAQKKTNMTVDSDYRPVYQERHLKRNQNPEDDDFFTSDNQQPTISRETDIPMTHTFEEMGINRELLRSIYSMGFEKPSDIQKKAIIPIIEGRNLMAQAASGTGKTGAFLIGCFHRIDAENKVPQVLVLSPARELARQTYKVATNLGKFCNIDKCLLMGGEDNQQEAINKQLIIGTPGRVLENIRNRFLDTSNIKIVVLDEADRMLSPGFSEQLSNILSSLNQELQILLFSATMPDQIVELADKFIRNPFKILVDKDKIALEGIRQYYVYFPKEQYKIDSLVEIYSQMSVSQSIIYCNFIEKITFIYEKMREAKFPVFYLHSDMSQQERNQIMDDFVQGKFRILITTDVLARGIDVQQISLVINYDMCREIDTYLHRIGRCGRWGRKGISINFTTTTDMK